MAVAPLFLATSGLNNALEPHRLRYGEDGGCPLASCSNVFVDHGGGIRSRHPRTEIYGEASHSFWSHGGFAFFVSDGDLYRLMPDKTTLLVAAGVGEEPMSFTFFLGRVYACNSSYRAIITDTMVYPWVAQIPQQSAGDTRVLGFPSAFSRCFEHAGRMCLIDGSRLWIGEPYCHACFDMGRGPVDLESAIGGAVSVMAGIYVSNQLATFFLAGGSQADFSGMVKVLDEPMIFGTEVVAPSASIGFDRSPGMSAMWVSQSGVYGGTPDGHTVNFTQMNLRFPKIVSGKACIHDGYYMFSIEVE